MPPVVTALSAFVVQDNRDTRRLGFESGHERLACILPVCNICGAVDPEVIFQATPLVHSPVTAMKNSRTAEMASANVHQYGSFFR